MHIFTRLAGALHAFLRRQHIDAELDEELSEYLAASVDAKVASGLIFQARTPSDVSSG
jgi:hypothetical protein